MSECWDAEERREYQNGIISFTTIRQGRQQGIRSSGYNSPGDYYLLYYTTWAVNNHGESSSARESTEIWRLVKISGSIVLKPHYSVFSPAALQRATTVQSTLLSITKCPASLHSSIVSSMWSPDFFAPAISVSAKGLVNDRSSSHRMYVEGI